MATFTTTRGVVTLRVGDDVEVSLPERTSTEGVRVLTGQVTAIREEENAAWVRGIRVDLAEAEVLRRVSTDAPENLTPPPE